MPKFEVVSESQPSGDQPQAISALAEGIETRGQLELLTDYRCDYGQGYYFSRPLSVEKFEEFIKKHAKEAL